jgi:hypothetical protein
MKCPNCELINPDTALRCDCGHDLRGGQIARHDGESAPAPARSETSRTRPLAVVGALVVFALGLVGIDPVGLLSDPEAVVELATGANAGITMANYQRLQTGMSYAQACAILGKAGTETSQGNIVGSTTVIYEWKGDGMANMNAMFTDDKLVTKAQYGLK